MTKLEIRCTEEDKKKWRLRAKVYCNGNLSEWVRYCLDNYQISPNHKKLKAARNKSKRPSSCDIKQ